MHFNTKSNEKDKTKEDLATFTKGVHEKDESLEINSKDHLDKKVEKEAPAVVKIKAEEQAALARKIAPGARKEAADEAVTEKSSQEAAAKAAAAKEPLPKLRKKNLPNSLLIRKFSTRKELSEAFTKRMIGLKKRKSSQVLLIKPIKILLMKL